MSELNLPNGWELRPLSSLATVVSGGTPSRDIEEYWNLKEVSWVTPTDITKAQTRFLSASKESISVKGLNSSSASLVPSGTILMTSRATLGEAKIAAFECCTNQGFKSLIPNEDIPSAYLYYLMQFHKERYSKLGIGSTFLEVNKKDTESFTIPVAPAGQREKIAKILSSVDDQIDTTQTLIDKYTLIKQGMMADMFSRGIDTLTGQLRPNFEDAPELYHETDLGWLPKGWRVGNIERFADVIDPNPSHRNPQYHHDGFPFISTVEFIERDEIEIDTSRRVIEAVVLEQEKRCKFGKSSIAFSRKGTIGKVRLLPAGYRFALLDSLCVINPHSIDTNYFYQLLRSECIKRQVNLMIMGQALPQVSIGRVRELAIPYPLCEEEQSLIGEQVKTIYELIHLELDNKNKLTKQKKGLMQDLLTGKVSVA